jgi:SAM-dependent methyltransferase
MSNLYAEDLAYIHHTGFGSFARDAAPHIIAALHDAGISRGHVTDLGCGSGIVARALVETGFRVTGIDVSLSMVQLARGVAPAADFCVSSLYDAALPPSVAVLAVGEGLTYIGASDPVEELPHLFGRVFGTLEPGGLFLFDLVLTSPDDPLHYESMREGEGWSVAVQIREDPEQSLLTRRICVSRNVGGVERVSEEFHRVRTFSVDTIEQWLEYSGFDSEVRSSYGAVPLPPRRAAFLANKPRAA